MSPRSKDPNEKATPKSTRKPAASSKGRAQSTKAINIPSVFGGAQGASSSRNYVHFSDKMTGALMNINKVIDENKGTLDSIQDMAIELTRAILSMRAVIMKYVMMADNILETVVPIMEKLPVFPASVKDFAKQALELSNKISTASDLAEKVLPGVEASLMNADINALQASTQDVSQLTRTLQEMIPVTKK